MVDRPFSAQQAVNQRNHKQGGDGGHHEAPDNGAAQRRILLAAFSQAQGHGKHTDNHSAGGHDHGAYASVAGGERGGAGVHAFFALVVGEYHHQDAVGGGHADTHNRTHQGRD